jgi:hypothetical protein
MRFKWGNMGLSVYFPYEISIIMHSYMPRSIFVRQEIGTKICSKCGKEQIVDNFYTDKHNRDGLKSECKTCFKQELNNRRNSDPIGRLFKSAKNAARIRQREFTLNKEDIIIPTKCPILDIDLYFDNEMGDNSPSIDRINSINGYTKNNIIICSWRANHIKGNATIDEMHAIYNNWDSKHNNDDDLLILPNHRHYLERILIRCKERCNNKNIIFGLTKDDLKIPRLCPVLGLELKRGTKKFIDTSPSLDRIDTNYGYTPENSRMISWKANKLKNDATYLEYERICKFYQTRF